MARGINKVILVGNLGKDPEVRYMPNSNAVANVSVATGEKWKDKQSGETKERTEWHNIVFYNRLAEIAGEYLRKGARVYIEGALRTRKWQDKNGNDRYTTEIVANELVMLDGGQRDGAEHSGGNGQQGRAHPGEQGQRPAVAEGASDVPPGPDMNDPDRWEKDGDIF